MIDTHTHIYFREDFAGEFSDIISRSLEAGVSHFILPGVNESSVEEVRSFHDQYPALTSMAVGLHPTEVSQDWRIVLSKIDRELNTGDYKAIGETGMDLYHDRSTLEIQKMAFERQLKMAQIYNLPVIIHSRNAFAETLEVIEKVRPAVPLVFHSFTGTTDDVVAIRKVCDPFFGINGVVTYKNAPSLREALHEITLEKIVLETDAPYLTPVPYRGKRNDSSYLGLIRDKIGEVLDFTPEKVEASTDLNARLIFGL